MSGIYADATIYFASKKYLNGATTKAALRDAVRARGDLFEVNLISTPVSPGGLVNLRTAFTTVGVDEITVRSDDHVKIIGTIVAQQVRGNAATPGELHYVVK